MQIILSREIRNMKCVLIVRYSFLLIRSVTRQAIVVWANMCMTPKIHGCDTYLETYLHQININMFWKDCKGFIQHELLVICFCVPVCSSGDAKGDAHYRWPHSPRSEYHRAHSLLLWQSRCNKNLQATLWICECNSHNFNNMSVFGTSSWPSQFDPSDDNLSPLTVNGSPSEQR